MVFLKYLALFVGAQLLFSPSSTSDFQQHFRKIKEIHLSDEVLIGTIRSVDVDAGGRLLVSDPIGNSVYLFKPDGKYLKTLTAEACNPGINWRPSKAHFLPDGKILVRNANYPFGVVFSSEGECLLAFDEGFSSPKSLCASPDGIYTIDTNNPTDLHIRLYDYNGKLRRRVAKLPGTLHHINYRSDFEGLVCGANGDVLLALASGPELYRFDRTGKLSSTIRLVPSYHKTITQDIPPSSDIRQLMKAFKELNDTKTTTLSISSLDADRIMMQFRTGSADFGIQVIDTRTGRLAHRDEIRPGNLFILGKNGLAYILDQPAITSGGDLPNPHFVVYQYVN